MAIINLNEIKTKYTVSEFSLILCKNNVKHEILWIDKDEGLAQDGVWFETNNLAVEAKLKYL